MAANQKLTDILKGRTISGTRNQNDSLTISFTDGSQLTVKTAGSSNSASTGGTVADVRQEDAILYLDMEGGSTFEVPMAEANDVVVQDRNGGIEYPG